MIELATLAQACATQPNVLMQIHCGIISVHFGAGPTRKTLTAKCNDNVAIQSIIKQLKYGETADIKKERESA